MKHMICSLRSAKLTVKWIYIHFLHLSTQLLFNNSGDEAGVEDAKNKATFYKWFPGFCKNVEYNDTNLALVNNFGNNANRMHYTLTPPPSHSPPLTLSIYL